MTTAHECCWHMTELLHGATLTVRQRCCWCDGKRTVPYAPPETIHGPHIYRTAPTTTGAA